ncbi:MAG: hypothetical protein H0X51_04385 [Parachlamydiaceae bacterium]|nr:hypothetical protein [Parachlamydiaceae bacterium]
MKSCLSLCRNVENSLSQIILRDAVGMACFGVVGCVVTPFVAVVALPIFAIKACLDIRAYKPLYKQTLDSNGKRIRFGRVEGQDYTKWNGKCDNDDKLPIGSHGTSWDEGLSVTHGLRTYPTFTQEGNPFEGQDNIKWLENEKVRLEQKVRVDFSLKWLKASAKGLIPIIGFIWAAYEVNKVKQASRSGCNQCQYDGRREALHWSRKDAVRFHLEQLIPI